MSEDQEQRGHPILAIVLTAVLLAPPVLGFIDDYGFEVIGEIAWELAHGLPTARRKVRAGWREHGQRAAEREA